VRAFGPTLLLPVSGYQESGSVEYAFRSTDGGATWTYLARGKDASNPIVLVTASRWLQLIAPGQSAETTDAGVTWHLYASAYSQAAPIAADFVFADSQVGYGTVRGEMSRTVDSGLHWVSLKSPGT
jgi:BNR/Asp-box repeat.